MTKHRVKIQFNDPPEAYYAEAAFHLMGPFTEKMIVEGREFEKSLPDYDQVPGQDYGEVYFAIDIGMKPG